MGSIEGMTFHLRWSGDGQARSTHETEKAVWSAVRGWGTRGRYQEEESVLRDELGGQNGLSPGARDGEQHEQVSPGWEGPEGCFPGGRNCC